MEEHYPKSLAEFEEMFGSVEQCRHYLFELRWPDGFDCPRCHGRRYWPSKTSLLVCANCQYQVSVTAGTVFQDTHKPLSTWFRAMWWVTSQKNGASALGLQRVLGLGSYRTAWTWLHKLRRAMVRPGRDRLHGQVQVDETYWGALEEGRQGREPGKKAMIVVAVEKDGRKCGRTRLRRVQDASGPSLCAFVKDNVEPGSMVETDGWSGYGGLRALGYVHQPGTQGRLDVPGADDDLLPYAHRVISLFKRWLLGTHQGAISAEHLDYYLDEFAFRFNRRTSQYRGKLFYRLVQQAVQADPAPYQSLIRHVRGRKPKL
jgi:transposase-like protein/ribosomal protein L37AE/L43A